uniref:Uncharacterized protein n=1 Tax=Chenopodium quinoa TaxID=63459 RepID=A0A803MMN3_CHEQI
MNPPNVLDELESQEGEIGHVDETNGAIVLVPKTPEYSFNLHLDGIDQTPEEICSPLISPFPIKISDYLSEDENDGGNLQVDYEAEEFIKKFYDQLRAQSRVQLLQY